MVSSENNTKYIDASILETLTEGGLDRLGDAIQLLINAAMKAEREKYLGAAPYERSDKRRGYANGFKPKKVKTRIGELSLQVPQTRDSQFYPNALEKGIRSERALRTVVAEMYIQGVSTRKVEHILAEMGGFSMTSSTVSKAVAELDELFEAWRNRPLGSYPYIYLDARYENVREGGSVIDNAVLVAVGISEKGDREVLGVSVSLSEAEVHWRGFLRSLQERGLHGVQLVVSDDHAGLKAALKGTLPSVKWQRCQYHLQQNAQSYVPRQELKVGVADDIRAVFDAIDREEADRLLKRAIEKYSKPAPRLAEWMTENISEGLTVFDFPIPHRQRIRTTNTLERLNREIKRRTRVVSIFPNPASCLRLVTALAIEISEHWLDAHSPWIKF